MRLQRYLAQAAVASRRHAEQLIASGVVKVNGQVVTTPGAIVKERDRVEVDGKRVLRVDPVYRVLLKPRECLATLNAMGERPTLRRYLHNPEPGLAVVAPLDYPAEGVVLLTTDGELAAAISKRGQTVPMTYHIKMQGKVGDDELGRLARGWRWEDVAVRPAAVTALATTGKNTWIEIIVAEARPRALKAAGDIIRHSVLKISRVRLGSISFEGLKMGGWRDLSKGELGDLRQRAGIAAQAGGSGHVSPPPPPRHARRPARLPERPPSRSSERSASRSSERSASRSSERSPSRPSERPPGRLPERSPARVSERSPSRPSERPERGSGRPPSRPSGRAPRRGPRGTNLGHDRR